MSATAESRFAEIVNAFEAMGLVWSSGGVALDRVTGKDVTEYFRLLASVPGDWCNPAVFEWFPKLWPGLMSVDTAVLEAGTRDLIHLAETQGVEALWQLLLSPDVSDC